MRRIIRSNGLIAILAKNPEIVPESKVLKVIEADFENKDLVDLIIFDFAYG